MAGLLNNRVILITGASRGIGAAVAEHCAREGAHIIATGRDVKALEKTDDAVQAAGGQATLVPADLSKAENIEAMAAQISQRFGKLDGLVGNAGALGDLTPMPHTCPNAWDKVMNINVTANFQLIRCFDALLKEAESPRALFVTSGASTPRAYWGAYGVSKAALETMVKIYAAENEKTHLNVNLVNPGQVRTRMNAKAFPGADPMERPEAHEVTDIFVKLLGADCNQNGQIFQAQ